MSAAEPRRLGIYSGKAIPGSYVVATVPIGDGLELYVDGNSKITGRNGSFAAPVPNALSLPHIGTCPGSTPTCRASCYVHGLEENAKDLHRLYTLNQATLLRVLDKSWAHRAQHSEAFASWIGRNCIHGFRWHVSGDVMNTVHANWISDVCSLSRGVPHWIYTRSYWLVDELRTPSLTINLSVDRDNYEQVRAWDAERAPGVRPWRLCYLAAEGEQPPDDLPDGSVIFPDYANRGRDWRMCGKCGHHFREVGDLECPMCGYAGLSSAPLAAPWWQALSPRHQQMICPADFFGQSEEYRCGVCVKCIKELGT